MCYLVGFWFLFGFTLISSGAKRAASLTATGATSSIVIAGRFETIFTSGTG